MYVKAHRRERGASAPIKRLSRLSSVPVYWEQWSTSGERVTILASGGYLVSDWSHVLRFQFPNVLTFMFLGEGTPPQGT